MNMRIAEEAGELSNPGLQGREDFDTLIYGSPPLAYPAALSQYTIYSTPDPAYVTGRINVSAFANLGAATPWPFSNTNVPLNGHICLPRGSGPFPLAVFAHGNHNPFENSTPGYLYLCQLLASHGIIAATIDVNFLNGANFGENDARAIIHLEHLKQFRSWNNTAAHPLHGKVDLNRILIVGHSRGGEAVGHASFFNRLAAIGPVVLDGSAGLGPYRFGLTAVAAIAPTDRQYVPPTGPTVVPDSYFIIHGSQDADVYTFEGYHTFERAHAVDLANPTVSDGKFKAMLWVHKANHNQSTVFGHRRARPVRRCRGQARSRSPEFISARWPQLSCLTATNTSPSCETTLLRANGIPPAPTWSRNTRIPCASSFNTIKSPSVSEHRRCRSRCREPLRPMV
jgi:hypothetical protein